MRYYNSKVIQPPWSYTCPCAILPLLDITVEKSPEGILDRRFTWCRYFRTPRYCGLPCPSTILDWKVKNLPKVPHWSWWLAELRGFSTPGLREFVTYPLLPLYSIEQLRIHPNFLLDPDGSMDFEASTLWDSNNLWLYTSALSSIFVEVAKFQSP